MGVLLVYMSLTYFAASFVLPVVCIIWNWDPAFVILEIFHIIIITSDKQMATTLLYLIRFAFFSFLFQTVALNVRNFMIFATGMANSFLIVLHKICRRTLSRDTLQLFKKMTIGFAAVRDSGNNIVGCFLSLAMLMVVCSANMTLYGVKTGDLLMCFISVVSDILVFSGIMINIKVATFLLDTSKRAIKRWEFQATTTSTLRHFFKGRILKRDVRACMPVVLAVGGINTTMDHTFILHYLNNILVQTMNSMLLLSEIQWKKFVAK